jgi:hypothetical protein
MPKAIPKRSFLLRKDVVAKKGISIEVTADELKKFQKDLLPLKK